MIPALVVYKTKCFKHTFVGTHQTETMSFGEIESSQGNWGRSLVEQQSKVRTLVEKDLPGYQCATSVKQIVLLR